MSREYEAQGKGFLMAIEKEITNLMQKGLALVGCLLLCALFALPAHAAAPQNSYHYPGYNAAAEGEIDLMRYVKSVTLTVNGQEYTPQQLQEMKKNGKPLEMRVGDAANGARAATVSVWSE